MIDMHNAFGKQNPQGGTDMLLYSIIMFLTAVPMGAVSLAIYRGKTDLIHD